MEEYTNVIVANDEEETKEEGAEGTEEKKEGEEGTEEKKEGEEEGASEEKSE